MMTISGFIVFLISIVPAVSSQHPSVFHICLYFFHLCFLSPADLTPLPYVSLFTPACSHMQWYITHRLWSWTFPCSTCCFLFFQVCVSVCRGELKLQAGMNVHVYSANTGTVSRQYNLPETFSSIMCQNPSYSTVTYQKSWDIVVMYQKLSQCWDHNCQIMPQLREAVSTATYSKLPDSTVTCQKVRWHHNLT